MKTPRNPCQIPGRVCSGGFLFRAEQDLLLIELDPDLLRLFEGAAQQFFRQRVLDEAFDRAPQRTGAELRFVPLRDQEVLDFVRDLEVEPAAEQPLAQLAELDVDDCEQVLLVQLPEDDDVVDAVDELRLEELLGDAEKLFIGIDRLDGVAAEAERPGTLR